MLLNKEKLVSYIGKKVEIKTINFIKFILVIIALKPKNKICTGLLYN
jgi:hypothetical protein